MAFLDNSGDIILDAVLTKTGREKLSSGTGLNITQFALGDDEINYALYDKSHPSGSAYYDLEIMQTPILEGFTQINANINYGLLSYTDEELLYLPEMLRLEKTTATLLDHGLLLPFNGIYYFAVNGETLTALQADWSVGTAGTNNNKFSQVITDGAKPPKAIFVETGFDTNQILRSDRDAYTAYADTQFTISVDKRFINSVLALDNSSHTYENNSSNALVDSPSGNMSVSVQPVGSTSHTLLNYLDYSQCYSAANKIQDPTSAGAATEWTNFAGPGLSLFLFSFGAPPELRSTMTGPKATNYTDYGTTGLIKNAAGADSSYTYNYIDTMVYVTGNTSSATLSVPVRIIRRES